MATATWDVDIENAIVTALLADPDLTSLCTNPGKIEVGLLLPMETQLINAFERPYLGVKFLDYTKDLGKVPGSSVGFSIHDARFHIDIQHAGTPQRDVEAVVKKLCVQIGVTLGKQRKVNPFGINTNQYITIDMEPGGGGPSRSFKASDAAGTWVTEGDYDFTVRVKVKLS
jgi:hypothetical protein